MVILALDPGGTTGWALANDDYFSSGQWDYDEVWGQLDLILGHGSEWHLIVESFIYRPHRQKIDFRPVEIIGVVKLWARLRGIEIVWQMPSQVKHFFTDERLKERDVYKPGKPHANDATRHLLYYLEFG